MKNSESEALKFNLSELSWDEVGEEKDVTRGFPCYDDMCFEGEVTGKELGITYGQIINKTNMKGAPLDEPEGTIIGTIIGTFYEQELAKGGIWLKFTDYKESVKQANKGKPYTFYVAKKPVLKNVSWLNLESLGMVYGPDTVDSNGPKSGITTKNSAKDDSFGIRESYRPTILDGKYGKYQVSLMRGLSNYGDKEGINSDGLNEFNSQWNRSILAITTSYRGYNDDMEDALKTRSDGTRYADHLDMPNMDLKYKTGNYNWFGDLTTGAWDEFQYNNEQFSGVNDKGQRSWTQDFCVYGSYRSVRGNGTLGGGAANSVEADPYYGDDGFRPVLSPID